MAVEFTINVLDTNGQLEGKLLDAIARQLNTALEHAKSGIIVGIQDLCDKLIDGTPEYQALIRRDELLGELGIPDVERRLTNILQGVHRGIEGELVPLRRRGNNLVGGLFFGIMPRDLTHILSLPDATYETEKGQTIPWLEWLTQMGDRIIVWGYDVEVARTASARARSRTGLALMTKGSGWRIPPEFSGSPGANFLTRAFDVHGVEQQLAKIVQREIKRRL